MGCSLGGLLMPGKHNAGGCGCCGGCATCDELFAEYGYTTLELSDSAGAILLYTGPTPPPPPTPETWAGFADDTLAIPSSNSGPCSDQIIQEVGMSSTAAYYFADTDPVKFWAGPFVYARIAVAITYTCVANVPGRGIGINVQYEVTGDVAAQYSEGSFTDWTWDTHVTDGRRATKTFGDGSVAVWTRQPSSGGRTAIAGGITHTESDLEAGNPVITTLTMPTFPYDYLGIMVGTVTIS